MLSLLECYMLDKQILFLLFDFFLKYLLNISEKIERRKGNFNQSIIAIP